MSRIYSINIRWVTTPFNPGLMDSVLSMAGDWIRYNGETWFLATEQTPMDIRLLLHPESDATYVHFEGGAEHPFMADAQTLGDQVQQLTTALGTAGTVQLIPDKQITPGGCRVETRFGVIDQQFEAQLKRIEEELV